MSAQPKPLEPGSAADRRILFIVNPAAASRRADRRWRAFKQLLEQLNIRPELAITTGPGHARELAQRAAADKDVIVAVGGDGTVSEVADGILSNDSARAALAVVPFGTGNDLAQVLNIRTELDALNALGSGFARSIDAIQIECHGGEKPVRRYALLFAGVGIIADAVKATTQGCKRVFGQRLAYPVGITRALWSYRAPFIHARFNEEVVEQNFLFIGASNTEIAGGGMRIAPGGSIDDGLLNLNVIAAMGRWRALMQLARLCRGRHTKHAKVRYLTARTLEIETTPPIEVAADGEIIGQTPARISVRPQALRVLVPAEPGSLNGALNNS